VHVGRLIDVMQGDGSSPLGGARLTGASVPGMQKLVDEPRASCSSTCSAGAPPARQPPRAGNSAIGLIMARSAPAAGTTVRPSANAEALCLLRNQHFGFAPNRRVMGLSFTILAGRRCCTEHIVQLGRLGPTSRGTARSTMNIGACGAP
jgi:hypothetical protein